MTADSAGLYLHIPFCARKCPYCDFYSLPFTEEGAQAYAGALLRAMKRVAEKGELKRFSSLYLGGGTPSLLGAYRLACLLEGAARLFSLSPDCEITLEANPGTVGADMLKSLRKTGYNRISVGVQSGVDGELAALGRIHAAEEARTAVLSAYNAGFDNISADLMLAIPGQTGESLGKSLDFLKSLPLSHISAYLLKVEEATPFGQAGESLILPGEDETADLYYACCQTLEWAGFSQYEISNFARPGYESRHNLGYWRCLPYLGLGPSAHSFFGGRRRFFGRDIKSFVAEENPLVLFEDDGPGGDEAERLMLGLRLAEGFDTAALKEKSAAVLNRAEILSRHGLCGISDGVISLSRKGFLLSNSAILFLLEGLE
ncbi:MAG: radical SAM family heme chaperone HemW [Oscillospiraceae bacterium]|jgi:oxygen-independent coproporphyrinogen-3 oxidase|nr:radical SAM family heme chaperone HemW [Oscillospiraceae bacterium]